ncbi:MAG: PqqD family protein [Alistipes sp.]|nr:PqqD family protein [Alistipes sp.]
MKIAKQHKVREMAGEHIVVMPGRHGVDMTRVVALNATSLYLWEQLAGLDFTVDQVAERLVARYEIDIETARRDAEKWVEQLASCGLLE